jgi:hypothetical protein
MGEERYLEAARRVMEKAEKRRGVVDAPCKTCRYYKGGSVFRSNLWDTCTNPLVAAAAMGGDDSYDRETLVLCDTQRSVDSPFGEVVCGPNGLLHEPR